MIMIGDSSHCDRVSEGSGPVATTAAFCSSSVCHAIMEREFFIEKLLVRIHVIIEMVGWTGLAPWEFEFPFPGSLTSTFLAPSHHAMEFDHFIKSQLASRN